MSAQDRFDLTGTTALVTGGSRGIGAGIAIGLAEHGADVAIVYRSAEKQATEIVEQIEALGRRAWAFQQDLAETEELAGLAERVWKETGGVSILVNNAGMAYFEWFNEVTVEHWKKVMAVNLDAVFFLTQALTERMIAEGMQGRIINISSKNGFVGEAGLTHYNASKGALELLTQSLAIELGPHGVTVNTIAPGIIETEIGGEFDIKPGFWEYYYEHIPLQARFGTVEDCVGAAVFLASRAGAYMTGQHLIIDGGVLCDQMPRMQFMKPYRNTITGEEKDMP
jgi:NAD(P)-dependent dehydrogenase (short-subunit alcohol dehydrogenase family)